MKIETVNLLDETTWGKDEEKVEEKGINKTSLTPRQWALYRLIEHNSLVECRKTSQREVCAKLSEYGYVWSDDEKTHDHCSAVWKDIKDNNESLEHDKLIISDNFYYWIGSDRETKKYIAKLWRDLSGRLHRYWAYRDKIKRDGQGKTLDNFGNPLSDKAKRFHECFNDYDIEMQQLMETLKDEGEEE